MTNASLYKGKKKKKGGTPVSGPRCEKGKGGNPCPKTATDMNRKGEKAAGFLLKRMGGRGKEKKRFLPPRRKKKGKKKGKACTNRLSDTSKRKKKERA